MLTLLNEEECYSMLRECRWTEGVKCPSCKGTKIWRKGHSHLSDHCYRYMCRGCGKKFDDLTSTLFSGRHRPLKTWLFCLYLMSLNISNRQIAMEIDLCKDDVQRMTSLIRRTVRKKLQRLNYPESLKWMKSTLFPATKATTTLSVDQDVWQDEIA